MPLNWNSIQSQRATRTRALAGTPEPPPAPTVLNESVSNINVSGVTSAPSWRIVGVSNLKADPITGVVPEPEPVERFPARPRPEGFPVSYQNLDAVLDAALIAAQDLQYEETDDRWRPGGGGGGGAGQGDMGFP